VRYRTRTVEVQLAVAFQPYGCCDCGERCKTELMVAERACAGLAPLSPVCTPDIKDERRTGNLD
jgi:hypothetical protein